MLSRSTVTRYIIVVALAALSAHTAIGRVERAEVSSRSDLLEGKAFGDTGAYEKLIGQVHFAVKPEDAPNSDIRREQARIVDFRIARIAE